MAVIIVSRDVNGSTQHNIQTTAPINRGTGLEVFERLVQEAVVGPRPRFNVEELPDGAVVTENGGVTLKRQPDVEPQTEPPVPAPTPPVVGALRAILTSDRAGLALDRIAGHGRREMYRNVLLQLLAVAAKKTKWEFSADSRWLGEQLGKSHTAAISNMRKLDAAGLVRWRHAGNNAGADSVAGRPPMQINLSPLVRLLNNGSSPHFTNLQNQSVVCKRSERPPVDVFAKYAGNADLADASRATPYKFGVARRGDPTVLMRPLTDSALTILDYAQTAGAAFTRSDVARDRSMTRGAAAGGTRTLVEMGLLEENCDGPGRAKTYSLVHGWEDRLKTLIPDMQTYGARMRLILRNFKARVEYLERRVAREADGLESPLRDALDRMRRAKNVWEAVAARAGAYGRAAPEPVPWWQRR